MIELMIKIMIMVMIILTEIKIMNPNYQEQVREKDKKYTD